MKRLNGFNILLIEDNKVNQLVARELLTAEGADVDIADNGALGVERVLSSEQDFDVILMDIQMPVMDGYEATARLREHYSKETLPILAVTAHALDEDRRRSEAVGMNAHVAKPLDADLLISAILKVTTKRPLSDMPDGAMQANDSDEDPDVVWMAAGIDRQEALGRLLNKEDLLNAILQEFLNEYKDFDDDLKNAKVAGGLEMKKLAHTLKGASGNLGAKKLWEHARDMEMAAVHNDGTLDEKISQVKESLDKVLQLARSLT